jgi:hypothetical protein
MATPFEIVQWYVNLKRQKEQDIEEKNRAQEALMQSTIGTLTQQSQFDKNMAHQSSEAEKDRSFRKSLLNEGMIGGMGGLVQSGDGQPTFFVPDGYEVSEINSRGPVIKKVKPNVNLMKFQAAESEAQDKKDLYTQQVNTSASDMLSTIGEVKKGINNFGLFGNIPSIPGTKRADWESNVNKLLSQKIVDLMQSMKNASKTGATGFGQLSQKELKVLQDASTALNRGLSPKDAQKYLDQMEATANKVLSGGKPTLFKSGSNNRIGRFAVEVE